MIKWEKSDTSDSVLKSGDWTIVKFPWKQRPPVYVLWHKDKVIGRFNTAEEAKTAAK